MKRHRHTPEQIVRTLREGERMLNEGKDITEVVRHLEIAESTWTRWRSQYGGTKADEANVSASSSARTPGSRSCWVLACENGELGQARRHGPSSAAGTTPMPSGRR